MVDITSPDDNETIGYKTIAVRKLNFRKKCCHSFTGIIAQSDVRLFRLSKDIDTIRNLPRVTNAVA